MHRPSFPHARVNRLQWIVCASFGSRFFRTPWAEAYRRPMSMVHTDTILLRRLYTGESVQQAQRASSGLQRGSSPIPEAAGPAQRRLETQALLALLEFRNLYTRFPLGITSVSPEPDGITLFVESEERAAEILFNLLPTCASGQEVHGVPGLRIIRRDHTAIVLCVLGERTRLRLAGLPARVWSSAEEATLSKWIDPGSMQLCWRSSRRAWTKAEHEHRTQW